MSNPARVTHFQEGEDPGRQMNIAGISPMLAKNIKILAAASESSQNDVLLTAIRYLIYTTARKGYEDIWHMHELDSIDMRIYYPATIPFVAPNTASTNEHESILPNWIPKQPTFIAASPEDDDPDDDPEDEDPEDEDPDDEDTDDPEDPDDEDNPPM